MSDGEWTTVGKRTQIGDILGAEGTSKAEQPKTLEEIRSIVEAAENPLQACKNASWFSVLSSDLPADSLTDLLDIIDIVFDRTAPSRERLDFLVRTFNHDGCKFVLQGVLETDNYSLEHLHVLYRFIGLIQKSSAQPGSPQFKSIACAFYRFFRKQEHTSSDEESFNTTTDLINEFLSEYTVEEFEEQVIDGYPSGYAPPEDFRLIPTHPRSQDVDGGLPFLRPNIEKGPFKSLHDYLDVHYRLLREEYLSALRDGVRALRKGIYTHDLVQFTARKYRSGDFVDEFGTITLSISSNFGKIQEFKTGVLVALPRNDLQDFLYLTCIDIERDFVRFEFCNSSDSLSFTPSRSHQLLVLKSAYYEAFRHTLDALKKINELPFQSVIVESVQDRDQPEHWRRVDQRSFLRENYRLMNESQLRAFNQVLHRRVCLIQGPPGTGKTYVGLRIMQSILKYAVTETPIIVVCYTNHALDQFLEGMLDFTQSIVRIGGRSKSEKLEPYNFDILRNEMQRRIYHTRDDKKKKAECLARQETCLEKLRETEDLLGVVEGRRLLRKNEMTKLCWQCSKLPDLMQFLEVSKLCQEAMAEKKFLVDDSEVFDDPLEAYINARISSGDLSEKIIAGRMRTIRPLNRFAFDRVLEKLMYMYCKQGKKPRQPLTLNEKWRFYATLHWTKATQDSRIHLTKEDLADPHEFERKRRHFTGILVLKHQRLSDQLYKDTAVVNQLKAALTAAMLRKKKVIGLTVTGAAKRRDLLQELNSDIIIVEEAAEILEAHLVGILPQKTKQIILIGDHKQLSPVINNYTLERSFNFGVSLFERLLNNGMPYVTLNIQHRMKDEFLKLLVPHIYDQITSSPTVYQMESIRGMSRDLQFVKHKSFEKHDSRDSASKSNIYEAKMIVALLEHLAYQGYQPHQMVVLCAYVAQQQSVLKLLRTDKPGTWVRISTIDDYQGEECDIVIVSFVRCNPQNEIGFLARPNRVCVALSRAKKGLFCFGDIETYAKRSPVWCGILQTLRSMGCVEKYLELKCSFHGTLAQVRTPDEFAKEMPQGCCRRTCNAVLQCGHRCTCSCHLHRPHPPCRRPCLYVRPGCGHRCQSLCYREHGACEEIVPKLLTCGHTEYGPCSVPARLLECHEPCRKELPCGHRCGSLCSQVCTRDCMTNVPITRACGHEAVVACFQRDTERIQSLCKTKVAVELDCGHVTKTQCRRTIDMQALTAGCTTILNSVRLSCGHSQTMQCSVSQNLESYSCRQPVEVKLSCGHRTSLPCHRSTDESLISMETLKCQESTEVVAKCGHRITLACARVANAAQFCRENVEVELPCGHSRMSLCHEARNEYELRRMGAACDEQIFVDSPCGHPVEVSCGKRMDENLLLALCKIVVVVRSSCGHSVSVVCSSSRSSDFVRKLCKIGRTVTKTCGHTIEIPCSDVRSIEDISAECRETVETILKCKHTIEQICKGTLGDNRVKCRRDCDFILRCGHTCPGNCSRCRGGQYHQRCTSICDRTLTCGHPCTGICGRGCGPCKAPCQRQCSHGQCEKKCHEPCSSRSQTCRRRGVDHCSHQTCAAKTCWECDCKPCEEPCPKKHDKCGHACQGLCGEPCIQCFQCKPKRLKTLFGTASLSGRFLRVPGCDHVVDAKVMNQVMASWQIGTPRCINCNRDIPVWRRYNNVYNRIHRIATSTEARYFNAEISGSTLLGVIGELRNEILMNELKEDSRDKQMVRYYACQILEDLIARLKRSNSQEDFTLADLLLKMLKSLMDIHEEIQRVKQDYIDEGQQHEISLLTSDIFEDLTAMVDIKPDSESQWSRSVLDDISTHALRLKLVATLPMVEANLRTQLLGLVFAEGRFSLDAANLLLKTSDRDLRIRPFLGD